MLPSLLGISLTESVVSRSWEMPTGEPEPQRKRHVSSKDTPSVFQSAKPFLNSSSSQSSWTAACLLIPPTPPLPSLSPCPHPPPQRPQTLLTQTLTGPWGICASSRRQPQSSRRHLRRRSKSSPKTHTSAPKFALAPLSHLLLEVCPPNRCLCWCPSLTSSPDPQHLNSGPARWCSNYCYTYLQLIHNFYISEFDGYFHFISSFAENKASFYGNCFQLNLKRLSAGPISFSFWQKWTVLRCNLVFWCTAKGRSELLPDLMELSAFLEFLVRSRRSPPVNGPLCFLLT